VLPRGSAQVQARTLVTATSIKPMKRFYKETSVEESGAVWRVLLDKRPVKTPKGSFLELPTLELAQAVAQEWGSQGENLRTREMTLTTVGCTAVDLVRPEKAACVNRMLPYLAMDTLCFEDDQELLAEMQAMEWGPVRQWFEERFQVELRVGRGIMGPRHPQATESAVEEQLQSRDEWELCALEICTNIAKSFIVSAALLEREDVHSKDAFRWALLEEHYQIERWGLVEGEHDVSHTEFMMWMDACRRFGQHGRTLPPE